MAKKSNYKRLGEYIRQVDVRNRDLAVDNLLGLSNTKVFIPSIANTIGTDFSNYKIVYPRQFAYVPITSRNGDKITVALYSGEKPCIVSQDYIVFEVIDYNKLLPEYLMMWFSRLEFDRYSRFKSHGSAREAFDWNEMCEVTLPIPPIEEQRKIVAEYQAVARRIDNNRLLIATLEATAQSIYRHYFVDDIDPENLPNGWCVGQVGDVMKISSGKSLSDKCEEQTSLCMIPVAGASGIIGYTRDANQFEPFLTTGRVGTLGIVNKYFTPTWTADNVLVAKSKNFEFAYQTLNEVNYAEITGGGVQSLITQTSLSAYPKIIPPANLIQHFESSVKSLFGLQSLIHKEILILSNLLTILLTKLSNEIIN